MPVLSQCPTFSSLFRLRPRDDQAGCTWLVMEELSSWSLHSLPGGQISWCAVERLRREDGGAGRKFWRLKQQGGIGEGGPVNTEEVQSPRMGVQVRKGCGGV